MSDIVRFPEANRTYTAPGCYDLPAHVTVDNEGNSVIISCWQLDEQDLAEVALTGRVWLRIWGSAQPPVYVGGVRPFVTEPVDN